MSLSRTVSEINGDFSRNSQIFPTHVYLTLPLKRFLGIGYGLKWSKKTMTELPDGRKSFKISLAV